jgi:hypothetical protein
MESSYPVNKSFSGVLTTSYFSQYNCLRFSYHMHGKHMGRLNVFGPDLIRGNRTLLWRIAGDQGNEWQTGVVRLEADTSQHFYEVNFFFLFYIKRSDFTVISIAYILQLL